MNKKIIIWALMVVLIASAVSATSEPTFDDRYNINCNDPLYNFCYNFESMQENKGITIVNGGYSISDGKLTTIGGSYLRTNTTTSINVPVCLEYHAVMTPTYSGDYLSKWDNLVVGGTDMESAVYVTSKNIYGKATGWLIDDTQDWGDVVGALNISVIYCVDKGGATSNAYIYKDQQTFKNTSLNSGIEGGDLYLWLAFTDGDVHTLDYMIAWNGSIEDAPYLGTPFTPPSDPSDTINLSTVNVTDGLVINSSTLTFGLYGNFTNLVNCSLYLNSTMNSSSNFSAGNDVLVNFTLDFSAGPYIYNVTCIDNGSVEGTSQNIFYVDVGMPTITTSFTNQSTYYQADIDTQINFSDELEIHSFNITIDGLTIAYALDLNVSDYILNLTQNITYLESGTHNFSIEICDGHTLYKLKNKDSYDWTNGLFNDFLLFEYKEPYDLKWVKVWNKDNSVWDDWQAIETFDRFMFKYKPAKKNKNSYSFYVESDDIIYIKQNDNTPYKKWVVFDKHWLDFYLPSQPDMDVDIQRISEYKVKVIISNLKGKIDEMVFQSTGDLNCITERYEFDVITINTTSPSFVTENEYQSNILIVNKAASTTDVSAAFYHNETAQTVTKTDEGSYYRFISAFSTPLQNDTVLNVSLRWQYNITSGGVDEYNATLNQTVYQMLVDDCTTFTMRAWNFTIYNESDNALVTSDINAYFRSYLDDSGNYRGFNLTWTGVSNFGVCIYPNWSIYTTSMQMQYVPTGIGYQNQYYIISNDTLDNNTRNIPLYAVHAGNLVTFTVTDQDDNPVRGAFIHILPYDVGSNSYKTSQIIETDNDGQAIGSIVLNTEWYRFMIIYNGITYLFTDPVIITTTTKNFRIQLIDDVFQNYNTIGNISDSLTFNNQTRNFAYTYVNPTGVPITACLNVKQRTVNRDILVNNSCSQAASGTILVNVGNDVNDKMFIATGTLQKNPIFISRILTVDFSELYRQWGKEGVFMVLLIRITLSTVALWNPVVALIMMLFADALLFFMGMFKWNAGVFVVYVIIGALIAYKVNKGE